MAIAAYGRLALATVGEHRSAGGRKRTPEPMKMDDPASVAAFHAGADDLQAPVYQVNAEMISRLLPEGGTLVDLGSGSGQMVARVAQARPDARIIGTDLAENMLEAGRATLAGLSLADRVELRRADMTSLPVEIAPEVHAVSCVWALHHLPARDDVLRCLRTIHALRERHDCAVWIFDFARLRDPHTMHALLDVLPETDPVLRKDALASERAAWTAGELRGMLVEAGLGDLRGGRERFIGHMQAWWSPGEGRASGHDRLWIEPQLRRQVRAFSSLLRRGLPNPARRVA